MELWQFQRQLKGTDDLLSPISTLRQLVLEISHEKIWAGFSGEENIKNEFPLVLAIQKKADKNDLVFTRMQNQYGKEALNSHKNRPKDFDLIYPLLEIKDSEKQAQFLSEFLAWIIETKYNLEITQINLFIIDAINFSSNLRLKLSNILFSQYKISSILFLYSIQSGFLASGRLNGLSLEMRHNNCNIAAIYQGFLLGFTQRDFPYGGKDSDKIFLDYIQKNELIDFSQYKFSQQELISSIKQKLSQISLSYEEDIQNSQRLSVEDKSFELPDGKVIEFQNEVIFQAAEVLIKPSRYYPGVMDLTQHMQISINKCDLNLQETLKTNTVMHGGQSQLKNLSKRLKNEYNDGQLKIHEDINRPYSAWLGGSMLGSIQTFQENKITWKQFEELGEDSQNFWRQKLFFMS